MKTKGIKTLIVSIVAIVICFTMLLGTTFAWFTDSVTSSNNKIESGTLKVDLELYDKDTQTWDSIKQDKNPIFNYSNWEPGYIDVKLLKVENEGSLALKWKAKFVSNAELSVLANVIDVYVCPSENELTYPARDLAGYTKVGTVKDFVNTIEETTKGELAAQEEAYLGIALKMQETAGNEYQNLGLINQNFTFDILIVATQFTAEEDSFGNDYDNDASLDYFPVSNQNELETAVANKEENILLTSNISLSKPVNVDYDANINGDGYSLERGENVSASTLSTRSSASTFASTYATTTYTGTFLTVKAGTTLELENVVLDGGAIWTGEVNQTLGRGTVNSGITAEGALVSMEANSTLILGEGAVLQNNGGANAVNMGTRVGAQLIINGGEIINNYSSAGAIWGGGAITLNSGKVNNNHGGIGGAIRVVTNCNGKDGVFFTMNGGEMNHNLSDAVGGAIWAGASKSNNVYVLNGGEMAYNYSPVGGGAIYAGYYETVKIGGTFKMHDNSAPLAGAIRFHDHVSFVMTGGEIYNNGDNSLFLLNNSASITGGVIRDTFSYGGGLGLTMGNVQIESVYYDLSTNHNTAYLAKEFNSFKFSVNEGNANFAQFNFKPNAEYVYVEGDEAKLICLNQGYETYWDAQTSTFRLKAI